MATCQHCNGTGRTSNKDNVCLECSGKRYKCCSCGVPMNPVAASISSMCNSCRRKTLAKVT